jgi:nucleotide-binding universal stress UspA family protein
MQPLRARGAPRSSWPTRRKQLTLYPITVNIPIDTRRPVLTVRPGPSGDGSVVAIAEAMAQLEGAQLVEVCEGPDSLHAPGCGGARAPAASRSSMTATTRTRSAAIPTANAIRRRAEHERAAVVVLAAPHTGGFTSVGEIARQLLDAGTAVLVVPRPQGRRLRLAHIGVGYDGGAPAEAALEVARELASAGRGDAARLEVAYVDDATPESGEADSDTIAGRREAMIDWWLGGVAGEVPGAVCPVHLIGAPAKQLARLSGDLDLLVIGRRGRPFLRRALTGSVSTSLIATTRCPLLIVPARFRLAARAENRHRPAGSQI